MCVSVLSTTLSNHGNKVRHTTDEYLLNESRGNSKRPRRGSMWSSLALKQKRMMPADEFSQGARRMESLPEVWAALPTCQPPSPRGSRFLGPSTAALSCKDNACRLLPCSWSLRSRLEPGSNSSCTPWLRKAEHTLCAPDELCFPSLPEQEPHVLGVSWTYSPEFSLGCHMAQLKNMPQAIPA